MRPFRLAHICVSAGVLLSCGLLHSGTAQTPPGTRWIASGSAIEDFRITVDSTVAHSGRSSLRIVATDEPDGFAGVAVYLPVAADAGHRLRVSAYLRAASLEGQGAAVWARVDSSERTTGRVAAFATTQGRVHFGGTMQWTQVSVDLDVPLGTRMIALGALSTGRGTLWVDDIRLEPLTTAADAEQGARTIGFESPDTLVASSALAAGSLSTRSPHEASRAITRRGLDNVVSFARLTGYVRFFHPSDEVLSTNWDEFTVRGVRVVEQAPTADSLAATFRALFSTIAPTVQIYRTAKPPSASTAPLARGDSQWTVFWQHCGYGVPAGTPGAVPNNAYHSVRRAVAVRDDGGPTAVFSSPCGPVRETPVPSENHPFVADLGNGISAAVPLAYRTTTQPGDSTWRPKAAVERFSMSDRATRLGDVALLWMVPQHFYPYFDVVHTDWSAALERALSEAATDTGIVAFDATLERLIAALHDGHGNVVRSGRSLASPDVAFDWVEGRVLVTAVGDSASGSGVVRGDEVVAIDGHPIGVVLHDVEERTSGATPQWIRHVALRKIAIGAPGTTVLLTLRNPIAATTPARDVRLSRVPAPPPSAPRPPKIAELRPGVLYVDLGEVTDADVRAALPRLAAASGIIFDMRGYPSHVNTIGVLAHLTDSTIHSARFQPPLVVHPDHQGMLFEGEGWTIPPVQPRLRGKIAFLTGSGAISYAESTMGVVEENHLGAIVGETTAGTNGNVNPFALPGGYIVIWTGMRVQKRDGTPHHGVGIHPTVHVSPTIQGIRAGRDEMLERALGVVVQP